MNAVPTFPLQASTVVEVPVVTEASVAPTPDVRELLRQLPATQRKELLADLFRDDLKALVSAETAKGFQAGQAKAEQALTEKMQQLEAAQHQTTAELSEQLQGLIAAVEKLPLTLQCEQQPLLLQWCVAAVTQVLRYELQNPDYLVSSLQELMQQSVQRDGLVLCCAVQDADVIRPLLAGYGGQLTLQPCPELQMGELKLMHGVAYRQSSLTERLEQLISEIRKLNKASS